MTLAEYLTQNGMSVSKLARDMRRPVSTVHGWVRGNRKPDWSDIPAIEAVTNGAVTADDFVPRDAA